MVESLRQRRGSAGALSSLNRNRMELPSLAWAQNDCARTSASISAQNRAAMGYAGERRCGTPARAKGSCSRSSRRSADRDDANSK